MEPKALLLMDNCAAHPGQETLTTRDGKITVSFLPKNTTSIIQPLDQGIIAVFKRNYRRDLVSSLVSTDKSVTEYLKALNLKEAIHIGGREWADVTGKCIRGCWRNGLGDAFKEEEEESDDEFLGFSEEDLATAVKKGECIDYEGFNTRDMDDVRSGTAFGDAVTEDEVNKWIGADADEPTYEKLSDVEIVSSVQAGTLTEENVEDDAEDEETEPPPAASKAVKGLEDALRFFRVVSRGNGC